MQKKNKNTFSAITRRAISSPIVVTALYPAFAGNNFGGSFRLRLTHRRFDLATTLHSAPLFRLR
jgi:hypothetical protein